MESLPKKSLQCPNCGANVAEDCVCCEYCHAVLTITACPSCFGAVFKGMKFCPACGAAVERKEIHLARKLKCPCCEQALTPADIGETRIQECSCCGGIWLDVPAFQKICADKEQQEKVLLYPLPAVSNKQEPVPRTKRFYVPCPECGELMNQRNFAGCSGVVIDLCKTHGIWFDRHELQQIANFIKDGGLQKARENELANLKTEQDRLQAMQFGTGLEPVSLQDIEQFPGFGQVSLIGTLFAMIKKFLDS